MISPASTELPSRDHLRTFYILTNTQVLSLIGSAMSLTTPYILTLTGSKATLGVLSGIMNVGIVVGGIAILVMTAAVYALPKTRSLEADLPDYAAR